VAKLGTKVGLSPGHVLDRDPALPPSKEAQPEIIGPYLLWPDPSQLLLSTCYMLTIYKHIIIVIIIYLLSLVVGLEVM